MNESNTDKGNRCESVVIEIMLQRGFTLIDRNYSVHNVGELDIVMEKNSDIYIVEVKARKVYSHYPAPVEAINNSKIKRIKKTTEYFLRDKRMDGVNVHFLASLVYINERGSVQKVEFVSF